MINFKGRCVDVKNADRITRSVNSIYPHLSESKISNTIEKKLEFLSEDAPIYRLLLNLKLKNLLTIKALRLIDYSGINLFRQIIKMLKNNKIGNCYELSRIAEIIAKINGQDNVYPMKIFTTRNRSGADMPISHVVSVITNKQIEANQKYTFKNKEAVILDPWLGITDFASGYLEKIKNDFRSEFQFIPDNDFSLKYVSKLAKNLKHFKQLKNEKCFNPVIKFLLHEEEIVTKEQANQLKSEYPELILKDFKKIEI